jgi:hypothetical protein
MSEWTIIQWVAHPSKVEPDRLTITAPDGRSASFPMPLPSNYIAAILHGRMARPADPFVLPKDCPCE